MNVRPLTPKVVQAVAAIKDSPEKPALLEALLARLSRTSIHMRLPLSQVARIICDLLLMDPPNTRLTNWRSAEVIGYMLDRFDGQVAPFNVDWSVVFDFIWICMFLHNHGACILANQSAFITTFCTRSDGLVEVPLYVLVTIRWAHRRWLLMNPSGLDSVVYDRIEHMLC
jgi:hypothetical protein